MYIGSYILIILIAAVFAVLVTGVVLMGSGGKMNLKYGNKLMIARVSLQGTILLVLIAMYFIGAK